MENKRKNILHLVSSIDLFVLYLFISRQRHPLKSRQQTSKHLILNLESKTSEHVNV